MNLYSLVGFVIALVVLFTGLYLASPNLALFLDYPSMFIVVGGTFAASAISFQLNRLKVIFTIFFRRIVKGERINHSSIVEEIIQIADKCKKGTSFSVAAEETKDFFLKEALTLLSDGVLNCEEIESVLKTRNHKLYAFHNDEANKVKILGKFPPAFGMIGTTIGMIVLLANLGGEDAMKMIGPAMGVCLITTLYGAVIANLLFIPAAENLVESTKEIYLKNEIILESVSLLESRTNPIVVAEKLNSYLRPGDRLNWKDVLGQGGGAPAQVKAA